MYASQKQFQPDLAKKRREREEGRKGATMLTLINYKTKLMTKHINSRKAAGGCGFWILYWFRVVSSSAGDFKIYFLAGEAKQFQPRNERKLFASWEAVKLSTQDT